MKHKVISLSTRRPLLVYAVTAFAVIAAAALMFRLDVDTDPENMLPADQSDRVFHNEVEQTFALHDAIYNPQSLANLHRLSQEILALDGVISPDLMSLATADNITQNEQGGIRFE